MGRAHAKKGRAKPPTVDEFVRAMLQHWLVPMAGVLSVVLTFIGQWTILSAFPRLCSGVAALLALLYAVYRTWAQERSKINELEDAVYENSLYVDAMFVSAPQSDERGEAHYYVVTDASESEPFVSPFRFSGQPLSNAFTVGAKGGDTFCFHVSNDGENVLTKVALTLTLGFDRSNGDDRTLVERTLAVPIDRIPPRTEGFYVFYLANASTWDVRVGLKEIASGHIGEEEIGVRVLAGNMKHKLLSGQFGSPLIPKPVVLNNPKIV